MVSLAQDVNYFGVCSLTRPGKLYVEKRFTKSQLPHAREEIKMIHKLKNSSLTFYTGAFIDEVGGFASMCVTHFHFFLLSSSKISVDEAVYQKNNADRVIKQLPRILRQRIVIGYDQAILPTSRRDNTRAFHLACVYWTG